MLERTFTTALGLGASPRQVSAGVAWAQVLPAVPGALLGIGLYKVANHGGMMTLPPAWWLAAAVVTILAAVGAMASIPALIGTHRSAAQVLQAETA